MSTPSLEPDVNENPSDLADPVAEGGPVCTDTADIEPACTQTSEKGIKRRSYDGKACVICEEPAAGQYFGAFICLPCKSFYIRCTKNDPNPNYTCAFGDNCQVNKNNRLRCQACRFKKCLTAGMCRKEKPDVVEAQEGQETCMVCGDIANGCHFGVFTCEGCKKFFRRGMHEAESYECKSDKMCVINHRTRNDCRYCRYQKCITLGMSKQAIKMGRPKKVKVSGNCKPMPSLVSENVEVPLSNSNGSVKAQLDIIKMAMNMTCNDYTIPKVVTDATSLASDDNYVRNIPSPSQIYNKLQKNLTQQIGMPPVQQQASPSSFTNPTDPCKATAIAEPFNIFKEVNWPEPKMMYVTQQASTPRRQGILSTDGTHSSTSGYHMKMLHSEDTKTFPSPPIADVMQTPVPYYCSDVGTRRAVRVRRRSRQCQSHTISDFNF